MSTLRFHALKESLKRVPLVISLVHFIDNFVSCNLADDFARAFLIPNQPQVMCTTLPRSLYLMVSVSDLGIINKSTNCQYVNLAGREISIAKQST